LSTSTSRAKTLLARCFRILVQRSPPPDFRTSELIHSSDGATRATALVRQRLSADGPCEALNMHLRMNGEHRFVWRRACRDLGALGFSVGASDGTARPTPSCASGPARLRPQPLRGSDETVAPPDRLSLRTAGGGDRCACT
jgi:hypothetical protein